MRYEYRAVAIKEAIHDQDFAKVKINYKTEKNATLLKLIILLLRKNHSEESIRRLLDITVLEYRSIINYDW